MSGRREGPHITPAGTGGGGAGGSFSAGVSNIGNTAGDTGTVSNRVVLAGGNNITVSQSTNAGGATVTISGGAGAGGFAGGGISGGNTSGDTGSVTGRLIFAGGNRVTLSGSTNAGSQTITISGPNAQTGISGLVGSDATYTSGTVTISGVGGGVTVNSNTGQRIDISVAAPVAQTGTQFTAGISGGNTAGDTGTVAGRVVFAGGNNVTLSGSTNGASETITISGPNTVAQTGTQFSAGISGGNTAGDTGTVAGRVVFAGGNNITLSGSTNGVSETITISGGAGAGGFAGGGISGGNTAGDTGSVTGRLIFAGNNNITLSGSTNAGSMTISISAPNDGAGSVSSATTASSVTSANAVGADAGRYALEGHQHAGVGPAGVSNIGNTAGNTGALQGRLVLAGGNNITLSVSSSNNNAQTITISAPNTAAQTGTQFSAGISNLGNTAGDTGVKAARLVLVGSDNITLSGATNGESATVSISGGAGGGGGAATMSWFKQWPGQPGQTMTRHPQHTMVIAPMTIPYNLTAHTARLWMSATGATGSTAAFTWSVHVYTKTSNSLSLATSASSTTSWTSGSNASNNWGGLLGMRIWDITNQTFQFSPGMYFVATWGKSVNAGTLSYAAGSGIGASYSGRMGQVSNTSVQMYPGLGQYSATFSSAPPSAIALSEIDANMSGANQRSPDFGFFHSNWVEA